VVDDFLVVVSFFLYIIYLSSKDSHIQSENALNTKIGVCCSKKLCCYFKRLQEIFNINLFNY
jgi:hypothetical protein